MASTSYRVLGQSNPAATTNTDIYTVPATAQTVVSTLAVCNQSTTTTFRVSIRPGGASGNNQMFLIYDNYVNQYDTVFLTIGATLGNSDVVTVYAGSANLSFMLFGQEMS